MNRWERIVLALTAVAGVAWTAGGAAGFDVVDDGTLARHTLVVFAALLALVLFHGWVAIYVLTFSRQLAGAGGAAGDRLLRRARWLGLGGALLAIAAALLQFTLANALYPGRLAALPHALGGAATLVALVVAFELERRALRAASAAAAAATA